MMSKGGEVIKAWVTARALSKGITIENVEIGADGYAYSTDLYSTQYRPGDWHRTEAAAIARAEEMRVAKIASLEKQIAKLRKMTFAATSGKVGR